ncbi:dipeptide/oligopeptide/nickel ABC transporter ATP-binding protein [Streptomyces sp. WELS2]|uniref:ABC transporter ATP-binding protein n=1 Tax=Streptomyces sp. WELS2 TaxID=2749435 RepID=UPI002867F4C5|nr:dipeptide/oligopeptide/nickel ABC transporter ATP-binding protein [Streptomyces sp. WELS2]
MAEPILEVTGLVKHYPLTRGVLLRKQVGAVKAVDGVDFTLGRGETLGLVGESGCGKSTVARLLCRLERPTAGTIRFKGEDVTALSGRALKAVRRSVQMVFQDPYTSLNPRMTVGDIVGEPYEIHPETAPKGDRRRRVRELLDVVGLDPDYAGRYPHQFSGGQRQRIGIARALALRPEIVVADEPVSALDVSVQAQVVNLMARLQAEFGLSYVFIAHDLSVVRHISDRVGVMYLGRIVESGPELLAAARRRAARRPRRWARTRRSASSRSPSTRRRWASPRSSPRAFRSADPPDAGATWAQGSRTTRGPLLPGAGPSPFPGGAEPHGGTLPSPQPKTTQEAAATRTEPS